MDTKTTLNQLTLSDNGYGRLVAMIGAKTSLSTQKIMVIHGYHSNS